MPKILTKKILSRTDHLLEVRNFVSDAARGFGFADEDISKIALAVDEACTNIITHAYHNDPTKEIVVSVLRDKNRFEVRIVDEGAKFDPTAMKPLDLKEHLSHYRRGGLGVYLMRTLMDEIEYSSLGRKKNEVRLTKYLQPVRSSARG